MVEHRKVMGKQLCGPVGGYVNGRCQGEVRGIKENDGGNGRSKDTGGVEFDVDG